MLGGNRGILILLFYGRIVGRREIRIILLLLFLLHKVRTTWRPSNRRDIAWVIITEDAVYTVFVLFRSGSDCHVADFE